MELITIGLAIWLFFLNGKVKKLEKEVNNLHASGGVKKGEQIPTPLYENHSQASSVEVSQNPDSFIPQVVGQVNPEETNGFFVWLKQDFMVKLGAFLLIIAFGWFVSYAFANNWIGEMGRIMLGLVAGALIMILGMWRIETKPHQGGIFLVLGSSTIILTLYAAREIYDFFTPLSALLMMFASVALVAFVSVRYDRKKLALAGLILAGIAPLFTIASTPDVITMSFYLLVIVLGTLWVVYLRGWSILTFTALALVFFHELPFMFYGGGNTEALLFAFLFTAIFFVANIIGLMANENEENRKSHLYIAVGTGIYIIIWILNAATPEWQSMILVAWMLVFSVGSFIVYQAIDRLAPFYIYGGTSIVLLAAATAVELDGPTLTIMFTLEVAALIVLATQLFANTKIATHLSWLFVVPMLMSLDSIDSSSWREGFLHEDFVVIIVLIGALLFSAINILSRKEEKNKKASSILLIFGSVYSLALIWLVLHAGTGYYGADYEQGTTISLIVYTIIGIYAYIRGTHLGKKEIALGGSILLGLVIARLLFVEVWNMEITGRIITFLIIGGLLISTAFIKRSHPSSQSSSRNETINSDNN